MAYEKGLPGFPWKSLTFGLKTALDSKSVEEKVKNIVAKKIEKGLPEILESSMKLLNVP